MYLRLMILLAVFPFSDSYSYSKFDLFELSQYAYERVSVVPKVAIDRL
jgi:hypothetical protein